MQGRLLVISGPSGSGKSSIVRALLRDPRIHFSVSATTRLPRAGEVDGVHYRFVSRDEFEQLIESGELLEWARYNDNYYGTPAGPVDLALAQGRDVLLEIEPQGARQIRAARPTALMFFVAPPSMAELERRLRARGDTSEADIRARLAIAEIEMEAAAGLFDHVIVNDDLAQAIAGVEGLIRMEKSGNL